MAPRRAPPHSRSLASLSSTAAAVFALALCFSPWSAGASSPSPAGGKARDAGGTGAEAGEDLGGAGLPGRIDDVVVVTATLGETELKKTGVSVTVVTKEDLAVKKCRTVEDALAAVAGVNVARTGGAGHSATVMIRGAKSEHTLVLLDGVEMNDPMGPSRGFDFGNLTVDNIERIEVVRGPMSTTLGSDAMGGVVNIVTRTGSGPPKVSSRVEGGSWGAWSAMAESAGQAGPCKFSIAFSQNGSDGFSSASSRFGNSEPDGWSNRTVDGKLSLDLQKGFECAAAFRFVRGKLDLDNWGGAYGDDPNSTQRTRMGSFHGELGWAHPSGYWRQEAGFSYSDTLRDYDNPADDAHPGETSASRYRGTMGKLHWRHRVLAIPRHSLSAGYEFRRERGDSHYFSDSFWGPFESAFPGRSEVAHAIFIEDQIDAGRGVFVTGGVRADLRTSFGTSVNYRLSPVWMSERAGTRLRVNVGTGFKAPSLYQLYAPPTAWGPVGNADLRPERSFSADAGATQDFLGKRLRLEFSAFATRFKDLIDFTNGYENVGRAETSGVEFGLSWAVGWDLAVSASYSYTRARDVESGQDLLRRPRHALGLDVRFPVGKKWRLSSQLLVKGTRWDVDYSASPAARVKLPAYADWDAQVSWTPWPRVELYLRAENVLGSDTTEVYGYGTGGASAFGGVALRLR